MAKLLDALDEPGKLNPWIGILPLLGSITGVEKHFSSFVLRLENAESSNISEAEREMLETAVNFIKTRSPEAGGEE